MKAKKRSCKTHKATIKNNQIARSSHYDESVTFHEGFNIQNPISDLIDKV